MVMAATHPNTTHTSNGGRLVSSDGRALPLQSVHMQATAGGGIARVVLTQRFSNPYAEPLEVHYLLPLPSDGAVSGFAFTLGDTRVAGEVTGKQQARERFQRAIARGQTAALLEQDRTSLFTQRVGNIPPHTEIVAEVTVDQPLRWLADGRWEWRFPTVVAPRYQGQPGRVADAGKLSVPVSEGGVGASASLALTIVDRLTGGVESASHPVTESGQEPVEVRLGGEGLVRLDRDVVVRWPVALPEVSANVIAARPATAAHDGDAFALLTVAPPTSGGVAVPRDLTFLIDTSGSMGGRPLDQAAQVVARMIHTLGVNDRIEMIEFGSRPKRWKDAPTRATQSAKDEAIAWVRGLRASGATEMHRAVLEALRPLRENSQRQVVLVTDGYIGFEREIVQTLLTQLPAGARLHTVGVGSSVNRSLTEAAARAGRGTELIVGIDEDPERLVERLLARTTAPLVTDLALEGSALIEVAPVQLPDLYAESPALIATRLTNRGGALVLRGRTAEGPFEQRFVVEPQQPGQGPTSVAALFGREKVRDLETRLTAGGNPTELNAAIEASGVEFQIATRLTSWIAVSEQVTVASGEGRVVEQPHELPHGVSAEGLGLRAPSAPITRSARRASASRARRSLSLSDREGAASMPPRLSRPQAPPPSPGASAPGGARGGGFAPDAQEELEIEFDKDAADAPLSQRGIDPSLASAFGSARADDDDEYDPLGTLGMEVPSSSEDVSRVESDADLSLGGMVPEAYDLLDAAAGEAKAKKADRDSRLTRSGASFDVDQFQTADGSGVRRLRSTGRVKRAAAPEPEARSKIPLLLLLIAVALLALVLLAVAGVFTNKTPSSESGKTPAAQDGGSRPGVGGRR